MAIGTFVNPLSAGSPAAFFSDIEQDFRAAFTDAEIAASQGVTWLWNIGKPVVLAMSAEEATLLQPLVTKFVTQYIGEDIPTILTAIYNEAEQIGLDFVPKMVEGVLQAVVAAALIAAKAL